jgi:hypothetical protein
LQNTITETANGGTGSIPGFRVWDMHAEYQIPGCTRNVDSNLGPMGGALRMVYVRGHIVSWAFADVVGRRACSHAGARGWPRIAGSP